MQLLKMVIILKVNIKL